MTYMRPTTSLALALAVFLAAATPTVAQTLVAPSAAPRQPAIGPFGQPLGSGFAPGQPSTFLQNGIECMTDADGRGQFVPCSGSGSN